MKNILKKIGKIIMRIIVEIILEKHDSEGNKRTKKEGNKNNQ